MSADSAKDGPQPSSRHGAFIRSLPSIMIVTPPRGRYSSKIDERCFTYCSQSVGGRTTRRDPWCRSICIRKVFPHEVRNIIAYKKHNVVDADGKAKYPLPAEGQNLPPYLGGKAADADTAPMYWDEGYYLWLSKSKWAAQEKLDLMNFDLHDQRLWEERKANRKQEWLEYQDYLREQEKAGSPDKTGSQDAAPAPNKWWGPIVPRPPVPSVADQSILIPISAFPPIYGKIQKLLAPTYTALDILRESFASGRQQDLALRMWEKAWTKEPFILANRACSRMYERWKKGPPNDTDGLP